LHSSFAWVLLFTVGGSLFSVAAAGCYLLLPQRWRDHTLEYLVSLAIGMLLGAAFLHLLPEALGQSEVSPRALMATALGAILLFFLLEKGLLWRHHHHHGESHGHAEDAVCAHPRAPAGHLILIGDSFHNFLDGVLIAAAFLADVELGVVTAVAVIAHEIPQELGDFAILLHSGFTRRRALLFNLATSLMMIGGAALAWLFLPLLQTVVPYVLAFTAASFIYVAVSDLMPTLNRRLAPREIAGQLVLIGAGLVLNVLLPS